MTAFEQHRNNKSSFAQHMHTDVITLSETWCVMLGQLWLFLPGEAEKIIDKTESLFAVLQSEYASVDGMPRLPATKGQG